MRIIPVSLTLLLAVAAPLGAQTQLNDWSAVQAITRGQKIRVCTQSQQVSAEFQSATGSQLVITHRGKIAYLDKADVQQISYTVARKHRGYKWTLIGLGVGAYFGYGAAQELGGKALLIETALLGGLGALADHKPSGRQIVVVYRSAVLPQSPVTDHQPDN